MRLDDKGPASFYQEHVMDQYLARYLKRGTLNNALREFHLKNYVKTYLPDDYKNNPHAYVAASDDGYVAGELQRDDAVVYMRTFYDERTGKNRFGECRGRVELASGMAHGEPARTPRRDTPHIARGRGYDLRSAANRADPQRPSCLRYPSGRSPALHHEPHGEGATDPVALVVRIPTSPPFPRALCCRPRAVSGKPREEMPRPSDVLAKPRKEIQRPRTLF
ncbi:MAG: hypothetical protein IPH05_03670 [Flavobacteriales bacterium]|nr:hypothetical protein [Flavobacteriales bacterium]